MYQMFSQRSVGITSEAETTLHLTLTLIGEIGTEKEVAVQEMAPF